MPVWKDGEDVQLQSPPSKIRSNQQKLFASRSRLLSGTKCSAEYSIFDKRQKRCCRLVVSWDNPRAVGSPMAFFRVDPPGPDIARTWRPLRLRVNGVLAPAHKPPSPETEKLRENGASQHSIEAAEKQYREQRVDQHYVGHVHYLQTLHYTVELAPLGEDDPLWQPIWRQPMASSAPKPHSSPHGGHVGGAVGGAAAGGGGVPTLHSLHSRTHALISE